MRVQFVSISAIIAAVMMAMLFTTVRADSTGFGVGYTSADVGGNSQSVANKGVITSNLSCCATTFEMGLGLGIPYGIFGVNAEYYPIDNVSISAGLGTTILAGAGYDLGLQYYFGNIRGGWIPRISAHYGTNGLIYRDRYGSEDGESFDGLSAGIGVKNVRGNSRWVIDIFYVVTSDMSDRVDELEAAGYEISSPGLENITLGVGYSYSF